MPKKLAIAISGAVSLGSYEAGVIYEIVEAIAKHNETNKVEENRIEIDVITGASAGGMTASVLAQHLLCYDNTLRDPYNNPLYQAWVEEVDILDLLKVGYFQHKYSLLNSGVVEAIGQKHLKDTNIQLSSHRHPSVASKIQIGITMSNLSGYDCDFSHGDRISETFKFGYRRYKDQFLCEIERDSDSPQVKLTERGWNNDDKGIPTNWKALRDVGISSGAFPFAFQVKQIERFGIGKFKKRQGFFQYTDGGVFENEPIGLAKKLASRIDGKEVSKDRYYLYVAPGQRETGTDFFKNRDVDLLQVGIALVSSIFEQARFQDWIIEEDTKDLQIFSVTTKDCELIGEVFSAFAGFLEEKFRAYDYNIGRESARRKLREAVSTGLIDDSLLQVSQDIEWKPIGKKGSINGQIITEWSEVRDKMAVLAKEYIDPNTKERNQLVELQRLMNEVDPATRKEISKQLEYRVDSLVDYINNDYLLPLDKGNNSSPIFILWGLIKSSTRNWIGKPITKFVLKLFLKSWVEKNILCPPVIWSELSSLKKINRY